MLSFQRIGTFLDAPVNFLSGITDILPVSTGAGWRLYTATRPGGGVLSIDVGTGMVLNDLEATPAIGAVPAPARLEVATLAGAQTLLVTGGSAARLGGFALSADGAIGSATAIRDSPQGAISALEHITVGGHSYYFSARLGESAISTSRLLVNGRMETVATLALGASWQGVDLSDMSQVTIGGNTYLLALSAWQNALLSFRIGTDGTLTAAGTLGAAGGLGIAAPAAIETVRVAGVDYALIAGAASSSVSVVELGASGALTLIDHVIDSLDTRFQGVQALAAVAIGDRTFVLAGGGDDGLTLFTLLPGGRLLLMGTALNTEGGVLDNITALATVADGGKIEVFAAGEGTGITRLRLDPGPIAPMQLGGAGADRLTGDGRGDLLSGGAGNDTLNGAGGADILMDGPGSDVMTGGAGADIFVLARDGAVDRITDFEPGIDRLDLSAWGRIYAIEALDILTTGTGAEIRFGDEVLVVNSANGAPIGREVFASSELFGLTHVVGDPVVAGLRLEGTAGNDTLVGGAGDDMLVGSPGADRLEGGAGFDLVDYSAARGSMRIDLMAPALNTNLAAGDVHVGIEGVIGGMGADNIRGTLGDDLLRVA